jgi:hypothetical protein
MKTTAYKYYNSLGERISYSLTEVSGKTYDKIAINLPHGCKAVKNANGSTFVQKRGRARAPTKNRRND